MHLPDGIISFEQAMIYWIITLIIILLFFYKFSKDENKEKRIISIALFSVFTIVITYQFHHHLVCQSTFF